MESLQVRTGLLSIQILDDNGDPRGIFRFNPEDIESAKKVMSMQEELDAKEKEFNDKAAKCNTVDEKMELLSEAVKYFRNLVDNCYGEGTSDIVFGDANSLSMFYDFFEGIMPFYEKAGKKRVSKYEEKLAKKRK